MKRIVRNSLLAHAAVLGSALWVGPAPAQSQDAAKALNLFQQLIRPA